MGLKRFCHKKYFVLKKKRTKFCINKKHALRYKNKIITREASNKQGDKEFMCINA